MKKRIFTAFMVAALATSAGAYANTPEVRKASRENRIEKYDNDDLRHGRRMNRKAKRHNHNRLEQGQQDYETWQRNRTKNNSLERIEESKDRIEQNRKRLEMKRDSKEAGRKKQHRVRK